MLKIIRLFFCLSLLLLEACQDKTILNSENTKNSSRPNEAAIYNTQLGLAYLNQGDRPRAKRKLLKALELSPNSAETNSAMAYFLENTGDLKNALSYYKKALALAPKKGEQLNNYGRFLCRLGHYKEAEWYFLEAVQDPSYLQAAGAYENAGLCSAAIPQPLKAEFYFVKALEQDPERKQSLYELVKLKLKQNRAKQALADLENYPKLTLSDSSLLRLAIESAHRLNKLEAEENYKLKLSSLNKV